MQREGWSKLCSCSSNLLLDDGGHHVAVSLNLSYLCLAKAHLWEDQNMDIGYPLAGFVLWNLW